MAGKDTLTAIAEQLGLALMPLEVMVTSDEVFSAYMLEMGWDTTVSIPAVKNLGAIATSVISQVENGLDATQAPRSSARS